MEFVISFESISNIFKFVMYFELFFNFTGNL